VPGGAAVAADIVILAALVEMFTGAKAMAVQNYLAVKSQRCQCDRLFREIYRWYY